MAMQATQHILKSMLTVRNLACAFVFTGDDRRGRTDEAAGTSQDVTSNGDRGPQEASSNGVDGRAKSATGVSAELSGAMESASPDEVMASAGLSVATGKEGECILLPMGSQNQ